jgi:HlyD family secretion protein
MELKYSIWMVALGLLVSACSKTEKSDAYGQFEADEVTISAEAFGVLKSFEVKEGFELAAGQKVGRIDTTQLALSKKELEASIQSVRTNINKLNARAAVYEEQLKTAAKERERVQNLKADEAATQQQMDQAVGQVNVLKKQIAAIKVEKQSVFAELKTMRAKIAKVEDQLQKTQVINPIQGIVLASYAEPFELVSVGKPLYQIANLDELTLRIYVSGAQLSSIKLGQKVEVLIDKNEAENERTSGTISWIASEAEFTPRMIQTKEERVTQVYAVKVRVPNSEGKLKIGMPGEVNF